MSSSKGCYFLIKSNEKKTHTLPCLCRNTKKSERKLTAPVPHQSVTTFLKQTVSVLLHLHAVYVSGDDLGLDLKYTAVRQHEVRVLARFQ